MRVLLVDDHAVLLRGLEALVEAEPDLDVAGAVTDGSEALRQVAGGNVDILVTDHSMPGMSGLELLREALAIAPALRTVVLTMHDELHLFMEMDRAGAHGYVLKKDSHEELVRAIRVVAGGARYTSPSLADAVRRARTDPDRGRLLTRREKQILQLILQEKSTRDIAEALFISELTVETHRKNIYRKTGTSSLVGLINFAHANGMGPSTART